MSSGALAAGIAELLALRSDHQLEALSELSAMNYRTTGKATNKIPKSLKEAPSAQAAQSRQPAHRHSGGALAGQLSGRRDAGRRATDSAGQEGEGEIRRSSAASTMSTKAGGSSADSADLSEWSSDGNSESTPRFVGRSGSMAPSLATLSEPSGNTGERIRSTLKIANVPRRCGREELTAAIEAVGFGNAYDFFYLPLGPQSKKNHGYAFINFKDNQAADEFTRVFKAYPIRAKLLDVAPAPLQGLALNVEHFSKTSAAQHGWVPNVVILEV